MTFRILTGTPHDVQASLNNIEGNVKIESVETEFGKYGVERMAIVATVTGVVTFPVQKIDCEDIINVSNE